MGESLLDEFSAAIIGSGAVAVWLLQLACAESANFARARRLSVIGHLWLGLAVTLLLYRWVDAVTSLPSDSGSNLWSSGGLIAMCGIGLVAAVKTVIGGARHQRVWHFAIAILCGAASSSEIAALTVRFESHLASARLLVISTINSNAHSHAAAMPSAAAPQRTAMAKCHTR